MANYAVIENGIVSNLIVSDSLEFANLVVKATNPILFCVEIPKEPIIVDKDVKFVGMGWNYVDGEFIPPTTS